MIGSTTFGNPLLDALAEYRTGPTLLGILEDEAAGRVDLTSHFALDVVLHATAPLGFSPTSHWKIVSRMFEERQGDASCENEVE